MYKFIFFVPLEYSESVKAAVFKAGAGRMQGYDCCCFEYQGRGQFRPSGQSRPFLGEANKLEYVDELKVETVCSKENMRSVLSAFRDAHPYEVPAYDIFELVDLEEVNHDA